MKEMLRIGPIRWNQARPPDHTVKIELALTEKEGHPVFSCMAFVRDARGILVCGGQCRERLFSKPDMQPYAELGDLWRDYHLNDLTPGSPRQMEAIRVWRERRRTAGVWDGSCDYDAACAFLRAEGLYTDTEYLYNGKPYVYGMAWLVRDIPETALSRIRHWINEAKKGQKKT